MCIVIDINFLSPLFNATDNEHNEFKPLLEWIIFGKGKLVYGGKKYKEELRETKKYFGLLIQLKKAGKIVEVDDEKVDQHQIKLSETEKHPDFDDPHLIAIIIVSGCKLICSLDKRAYVFIKNKDLYPAHFEKPKIYKGKSNAKLLSDKNIAAVCHPVSKPNRLLKELLEKKVETIK